jgi:hypothetical protein
VAACNDIFIIAAAAPISGKRTTLVSINNSNDTAYNLANKKDTQGEGKTNAGGDGNLFHISADVEADAIYKFCHVRVLLTKKGSK